MLALILQISPDEMTQAEELISLLTDIESTTRKDCEFILFTRKDVEYADSERLLARLLTKFARARKVECWDFATGWPHGPNTMWCSLIRQMFHMRRMDELASDGALTFECDCFPIKTDWISRLSQAWDARPKGIEALGHLHPSGGTATHLNGNAIFDTNFFQNHEDLTGCHGLQPWDVAFAPQILKVAADTPLIDQWYRLDHFDLKMWTKIAKSPCVLFHGVKVPDGRRIAREQLLDYGRQSHHRRKR